jgi:nucleotide-binding universal stress UspA family protein
LLAGVLGVGGGFVRMPMLIYVLGIPTHVAIGTDLFEIMISASYGTLTHAIKSNMDVMMASVMHTGAAVGAQIGAVLTSFFSGPRIVLAVLSTSPDWYIDGFVPLKNRRSASLWKQKMKILIFVSSQSNSKSAVRFGGLIARHTQSSVTLLTVIENEENLRLAHQTLDKAGWWIPYLDARNSVQIGTELDGILEEINEGTYDLIILKARQVNQIKGFFKTKTGQKVSQQTPKSVLAVKTQQPELNRILICTSSTDIADPVVELGAWLAEEMQSKVTLLHITGSIPSMYTGLEKVEEHISEFLQTDTPIAQHLRHAVDVLGRRNVEAELELRHGAVPDEILLEAETGHYDLIVLGASKASTHLARWFMGDVTAQILKASRCPVMVVRTSEGTK